MSQMQALASSHPLSPERAGAKLQVTCERTPNDLMTYARAIQENTRANIGEILIKGGGAN